MEIVSIPAIVTIVCSLMEILKKAINKEAFNSFIPILSVVAGAILGGLAFYIVPGIIPADNVVLAVVIGAASGWAATGANQTIKQLTKNGGSNEKK